jgi:signal peptidase I
VDEFPSAPSTDAPSAAAQPTCKPLRWPWVGVLLSLFVPGFGLVRARQFNRGVLWLAALQFIGLAVACVWITRAIPTAIAVAALAIHVAAALWMLWDSYRPGRMTLGLWLLYVLALSILAFVPPLSKLVAPTFTIPTSAMEPTLLGTQAGGPDHVMVNRAAYWFSEPQRGDLMVFRTGGIRAIEAESRYTKEEIYIKRLVGLPGEVIEIHDGSVFANGRKLGTDDGLPSVTYVQAAFGASPSYTVPQDSYFVLGDNSERSSDSRYWGYVPNANVMGKVARIYWPLSRVSVPK